MAGVPFTDLIASQFMAWPEAVTSSSEPAIIEIELCMHSLKIMASEAELDAAWDAVARIGRRRGCKLRGRRWMRQAAGSRH